MVSASESKVPRPAETISSLPDEWARQLSPRYAQVLRVLLEAAQKRPGEYLTMRELAEKGWAPDRRPQDALQIKNNVQRVIYELRMKLGRDFVLNEGSTYRLNPQLVEVGNPSRIQKNTVDIPKRLDSQIRNLLREIRDSADLRHATLWGTELALTLRENTDELLEAAQAGRNLRIVCAEAEVAVDIVSQMLWKYGEGLDSFCQRFRGWIELIVLSYPLGAGVAWIGLREPESRLLSLGSSGTLDVIASGIAASTYIAPLEARILQLRARLLPDQPLIVLDSFDRTLDGYGDRLWHYFQTKVDDTAGVDATMLISNLKQPTGTQERV